MSVVRFTTWGSIRGDCGHLHLTRAGAEKCAARDRRLCHMQGGVSDRILRRIEGDSLADVRRILTSYDITSGPGTPEPEFE